MRKLNQLQITKRLFECSAEPRRLSHKRARTRPFPDPLAPQSPALGLPQAVSRPLASLRSKSRAFCQYMRTSLASERQSKPNQSLNQSKLVIKVKTLIERPWRSWLENFAQVISHVSNLTNVSRFNHKRQIIYRRTKISHKCPRPRSR